MFISFARLYQPRFSTVVAHFEDACRASRRHEEFAAAQLRVFGDHGPDISAVVRDHFPEDRKAVLRDLARKVSEASDRALAADMPAEARRLAATPSGARDLLCWVDDEVLAGQCIEFAAACASARLWRHYLRVRT